MGSIAHPPWVVPEGMGGVGGNGRSRRKTAVEESRKETARRIARLQADYSSMWNIAICYSYRQLLQLVRT